MVTIPIFNLAMKIKHINFYLIATILTLSASSFFAAYSLIDEILDSSTRLSLTPTTGELLQSYQLELKKLRGLDPANADEYRDKFFKVQDALFVFKDPNQLAKLVKDSYLTYFLILFIVILLVSIAAAFALSWQVSRSYKKLLRSDLEKSKRLQDLEYFDNWQNIASSLAHEIKNPLTPIEMMISNLTSCYNNQSKDDFEKQLGTTHKVILEEVSRLKNMVNHFGRFSKLPTPELKAVNSFDYFSNLFKGFEVSWPDVKFNFNSNSNQKNTQVMVDRLLIKQCFLNLVQNAIEANPQKNDLEISINITENRAHRLKLELSNNGAPIDEKDTQKLFQFGYSTKHSASNKGIGLSVVKKILLDHEGNIEYKASLQGVCFEISLPLFVENSHKH